LCYAGRGKLAGTKPAGFSFQRNKIPGQLLEP
jgi:hypothetical protein